MELIIKRTTWIFEHNKYRFYLTVDTDALDNAIGKYSVCFASKHLQFFDTYDQAVEWLKVNVNDLVQTAFD